MLLGTLLMLGDDNKNEYPDLTLTSKHKPTVKDRPRMPSNQVIQFYYDAENMECRFDFDMDVEYIEVEITETSTGVTYFGEVTPEWPVMSQPLTSGEYTVTCTTDGGAEFSGTGYIYAN